MNRKGRGQEFTNNELRIHLVAFFSYHRPDRLKSDLNVSKLVRWCDKRGLKKLNNRLLIKYDDVVDTSEPIGEPDDIILRYCRGLTPNLYKTLCIRLNKTNKVNDNKLYGDVKKFFTIYDKDRLCDTLYVWADVMGRYNTGKVFFRLYGETLRDMALLDSIFDEPSSEAAAPKLPTKKPNQNFKKRKQHLMKRKIGMKTENENSGSVKSSSFPITEYFKEEPALNITKEEEKAFRPPSAEIIRRRSTYLVNLFDVSSLNRNFDKNKVRLSYEPDTFDRREMTKRDKKIKKFDFSRLKEEASQLSTSKVKVSSRKKKPGAFARLKKEASQISLSGSSNKESQRKKKTVKATPKQKVRAIVSKVDKMRSALNPMRRQNSNFDIGLTRKDSTTATDEPESLPMNYSKTEHFQRLPANSTNVEGITTKQAQELFGFNDVVDNSKETRRPASMLPFRSLRKKHKIKRLAPDAIKPEVENKSSLNRCKGFKLCEDFASELYGKCSNCGYKRNLHRGESIDDDEENDLNPCSKFVGKKKDCGDCGLPAVEHPWYAHDIPPALLAANKRRGQVNQSSNNSSKY